VDAVGPADLAIWPTDRRSFGATYRAHPVAPSSLAIFSDEVTSRSTRELSRSIV
jgi:hypothetical protein